jgi:hypothetical protein
MTEKSGGNQPMGSEPGPDQPGGYATGGYGSMPAEQTSKQAPVATGPAPSSVLNATRLMFVRAAISLLSLIALLATKNSLRSEILKKNPSYDSSKLDTVVNAAIAVGIVLGIIFIVLYVFLALQVGKGKNWARIVALILAALGVLGAISSLVQTSPALSKIIAVVEGLMDLAIFVLLMQRASSRYFKRN